MPFSDVPSVVRRRMSGVRNKDTRPELLVRRLLHSLGYRFRLHRRDLPGSPDIVFAGRRKVVFVHGCFWHQHEGCALRTTPRARTDYWLPKFERNKARDRKAVEDLARANWSSLTIWECELKDQAAVENRLITFLGKARLT